MEICAQDKCTGCLACWSICAKEAIDITTDVLGKTLPEINMGKCIHCGLCQKVCPVNYTGKLTYPSKCYAVWSNHIKDQAECASGGIATAFARVMVGNGGIVFGAKFIENANLNLHMEMALDIADIESFRGSKYVQCSTGSSFQSAKRALEMGKEVLYVATPCQIDGLKHFLRRDYENLITVDIICHGVPPIQYLQEYAKVVCRKEPVERATFRGKEDFILCFYHKNRLLYQRENREDAYFHSFLRGLIFRSNCYQCPYARPERIADITIGDFWGLERMTLKSQYDGKISVVLIHSEKGERFFYRCESVLNKEERTIEEALKGNEQLRHPSIPHRDRERFEKVYPAKGFVKAIKSTSLQKEIQSNRNSKKLLFKIKKKILSRKGKENA